jgi:hypothetical protein
VALRLTKEWQPLTAESVSALPGQLGVFELADAAGKTVAFGFAGGRALFGLRSELMKMVEEPPNGAAQFRVEINSQYQSRFRELLMVYQADHGALPPVNAEDPPINLGRLSPL